MAPSSSGLGSPSGDRPEGDIWFYPSGDSYLNNVHYVYFIQSLKDRSVYVGSTQDLKKRFKEHNLGNSRYTRSKTPYKLIYYEAYLKQTRSSDSRKRAKKELE